MQKTRENGVPETFEAFLQSFGANPSVKVTFRRNIEMSFFHIITNRHIFIIKEPVWKELFDVGTRRQWWNVSRTIEMQLKVAKDDWSHVMGILNRAVEKMEISSKNKEKIAVLK